MKGLCLLILAFASQTFAHVGSPNVIFEGAAGPYPLRVVIKPPGVVPGLAEITVRVLAGQPPDKITVLPVHWRAGLDGAPPPDVAQPVRGEPRLFTAALWLMDSGAYSVHVDVEGAQGAGQVIVPVASTALEPIQMTRGLGVVLAGFGLVLFVAMAGILGAVVREGLLGPGQQPTRAARWLGRAMQAVFMLGMGFALYQGKQWWDGVDRDYRQKRMFQSMRLNPTVRDLGGVRILDLKILDPESGRNPWAPLVPDHGKLMHLFLTREPGLDTFAHLHPVPGEGDRHFEVRLPPLPPGSYRIYGDITHETGLAQTLTASVELPGSDPAAADRPIAGGNLLWSDPEDSWRVSPALDSNPVFKEPNTPQPLDESWQITRIDRELLRAGLDVKLRFAVTDAEARPAELQPFMGMFSHAAVSRSDGAVFNHLHPLGTISMAAQQVMQLRAQGKSPGIVTAEALEAFCKDPPPEQSLLPLEFPYAFPQPGLYRMWVQVKPRNGTKPLTGVFDMRVDP